MQKLFILTLFIFLLASCGSLNPQQAKTKPVSHESFTQLLSKYVNEEGMVDYEGLISERSKLDAYLDLLSNNAPNDSNWSDDDQIAYWINVYNAFTLDLVLDYYPVESIKDIGSSIQVPFVNTPWDIKFIKIAGQEFDLNNIEHNILRKNWEEPRIHFAVNCASMSCPKLRQEAYEGSRLDQQLQEQSVAFINNDQKNDITSSKAELSKYFDWYSGDFNKEMTVDEYINQFSDVKITDKTKITYKDYNWSLNEQE